MQNEKLRAASLRIFYFAFLIFHYDWAILPALLKGELFVQ